MPTPIDLNEMRRVWTAKYGAPLARRMLAGASGHAYDSARGLAYGQRPARDQEPDDSDEGINKVKLFLKNRLDPQDYQRLEQMLQALSDGGEPDDTAQRQYERNDKYAPEGQDEPEPFRGRPSGGRVEDAESALLPNGPGYQNIPEENRAEFRDRDRRYAQDSRGGGGYYAMFPSNAKVTFGYGG